MNFIEKSENLGIYNKIKFEKKIKKHYYCLFPKEYEDINSFAQLLCFLIYDIGLHYGCINQNQKFKIIDEKRLFYLGEKRKYIVSNT